MVIPLQRLERRKSWSQRPINIISGTHGSPHGNDWDSAGKRYGGFADINNIYPPQVKRHGFVRDNIDPQFLTEDRYDYGATNTPALLRHNGQPIILSDKLRKRIRIHNADNMTEAQFIDLVTDPNAHAIIGCCFSRNDEALRFSKKLGPVTSYMPDLTSRPPQPTLPPDAYHSAPETLAGFGKDPQAPKYNWP